MGTEFTLILPGRIEHLDRMVAALRSFCSTNKLPVTVAEPLELALHELATNVILYAWDDGTLHQLSVRVALAEGRVVAELCDDGRPFDPLSHAAPDIEAPLEERGIGGLGIFLAKTAADTLEYRRDGGCNRVRLTKVVP